MNLHQKFKRSGNMKLLIISAGVHPVPPVNGGAVENLIDFYLKDSKNNNIEVLSIYDDKVENYEYKYDNCKFHFIRKIPFLISLLYILKKY